MVIKPIDFSKKGLSSWMNFELQQKISAELLQLVYSQLPTALLASLFCAVIVFFGIYSHAANNTRLFWWVYLYLAITGLRLVLMATYPKENIANHKLKFWEACYTIGSLAAGVSWGLAGIILFPYAEPMQKVLLILMLSGVTGGAAPLSAAIPVAAISFLLASVLPFIIVILFQPYFTYHLFDIALSLYLLYTVVLVVRVYHSIQNSYILKFQNDVLLADLADAKSELEYINKKLELAATHDPLTRIANRSLFQAKLQNAIYRAEHTANILALFYFDIDHFKLVNDHFGHHVGDQLLLAIVERLKNLFGTEDNIARMGGDEFTVIVEHMTSQEQVIKLAKKLCEKVTYKFHINNLDLKVSVSVGVAFYPNDGKTIEELMRNADKAMYIVKANGGNNFQVINGLSNKVPISSTDV